MHHKVVSRAEWLESRKAHRAGFASASFRCGINRPNASSSAPPSAAVRPNSPLTERILASTQYRLAVFSDTAANSQCFAPGSLSSSSVSLNPARIRMLATMSS